MVQFIQVRMKDREYNDLRSVLLNVNSIVRIVLIFAQVKDGKRFACTEGFPEATIDSFEVVDVLKQVYKVGPDVLEKIGASFEKRDDPD